MILTVQPLISTLLEMKELLQSDRAGDFAFTTSNGTITISRYVGPGGDVTIPRMINCLPVTSIGSRSFSFCSRLTQITIPDSVTNIDESSFQYCAEMATVTIPCSVSTIGNFAFAGCSKLTNITIPAGVRSIGENAFRGCAVLAGIMVDEGNPTFRSEDGVLFNKPLTTLIKYPEGKAGSYDIPARVTQIWSDAFSNCRSLTSIAIHPKVTSIGTFAFDSCLHLNGIRVDSINSEYSSVDGVLFTKNMTVIIQFPGGKAGNYAIPDGVTRIADCAFANCTGLTNVTFPNSVIEIGRGAFSGCKGLTNITIPNNVKHVGDFAFFQCDNLTLSGVCGLKSSRLTGRR